jgi:tartrate-resistant acid phosphatase type 5
MGISRFIEPPTLGILDDITHNNMVKRLTLIVFTLILAAPAIAQEVNLLAMGDWGANGPRQREVAAGMTRYIQSAGKKFDAMVLAGDNFYVALEGGIHDPKWKTMFEDLYDAKTFDFPWYVALGNHDYQLDRFMTEFAYAQANPQSRWKMPARWYRVDLPSPEDPIVTVLMLDSNLTIMGEYGMAAEMKWLQTELAKPREAKWLIAVAHHPFVSNGDHGDTGPLARIWGPLFEQAKVDFYIAGHEHDLQHLQVEQFKATLLMVGGGGAGIRPMRNASRGPFSKSTYGFGHLTFTENEATARLLGPDAQVLHAFKRDLAGNINITQQGKSDPATPRTVRDVTRGGAPTRPAP